MILFGAQFFLMMWTIVSQTFTCLFPLKTYISYCVVGTTKERMRMSSVWIIHKHMNNDRYENNRSIFFSILFLIFSLWSIIYVSRTYHSCLGRPMHLCELFAEVWRHHLILLKGRCEITNDWAPFPTRGLNISNHLTIRIHTPSKESNSDRTKWS